MAMGTDMIDMHREADGSLDVTAEATRYRAMAEADERIAAAASLEHVRRRHLVSAAAWTAQAERMERAAAKRQAAVAVG